MARTKSANEKARFEFSRKTVESADCPPERSQALFWDTKQSGLGLRVTPTGKRTYIFESILAGKTLRITIGPGDMPLQGMKDKQGRPVVVGARTEAARFATMVAQGIDPRAAKAATIAGQQAEREAAKAERRRIEITGLDAWAVYCEDRRAHWGTRNHADHLKMVAVGGAERKRSKVRTTVAGPLRSLLAQPLMKIDAEAVEQWVTRETRDRPARAALGFRLLRAFVNWCVEHPEYRVIVNAAACKGRRTREKLARPAAKDDALQREQLKAWFAAVRQESAVPAAYLQALLLTGARREELAGLRWEDVDFRWKSLRIKDKVEGDRIIPLTPYVAELLRGLLAINSRPPTIPRRLRADPTVVLQRTRDWKPSPWVFFSRAAGSGRLQEPRANHVRALAVAGLPHVTLHGLRRSFGTLSEWVEVPVGIVAQIMGHKPSAIAEKHYRVRPLDLLRKWHEQIEAWILHEAGIEQPKVEQAAPALRVVAGADA